MNIPEASRDDSQSLPLLLPQQHLPVKRGNAFNELLVECTRAVLSMQLSPGQKLH